MPKPQKKREIKQKVKKVEKVIEKEESEDFISEDDSEKDLDEISQEAKMFRDSDSEAGGSDQDATEFLAHGDDLDLPSEASSEGDLDVDDEENMDDYYEELGIKHEKDYTGKEELYKKTKKQEKKPTEKKEPSQKSKMIDALILNTKKDPNYKNIVRVIKIVRQLFNKDQDIDPKKEKE